jgi:hypothetical protein
MTGNPDKAVFVLRTTIEVRGVDSSASGPANGIVLLKPSVVAIKARRKTLAAADGIFAARNARMTLNPRPHYWQRKRRSGADNAGALAPAANLDQFLSLDRIIIRTV